MACSSDTELSEGEDCRCKTDEQLWALLPRQFRKELGGEGGALPATDVLAFLVDQTGRQGLWFANLQANRVLQQAS